MPQLAQPQQQAPQSMEVEPGAWLQLQEEDLALRKYIADLQNRIDRLQIQLGKEANKLARERLEWEIQRAKDDLAFRREELAEKRRQTELALATSPVDFVAYEMYKRYLQKMADQGVSPTEVEPDDFIRRDVAAAIQEMAEQAVGAQGYTAGGLAQVPRRPADTQPFPIPPDLIPEPLPHEVQPELQEGQAPWPPSQLQYDEGEPYAGPFGVVHTDEEIQAMIAAMVGTGGASLGLGAFGVRVPGTQAISRQEGLKLSPDEMATLNSFLRAGFEAGGQQVSYDPTDYWREVQEGWIPTIKTQGPTQYSF